MFHSLPSTTVQSGKEQQESFCNLHPFTEVAVPPPAWTENNNLHLEGNVGVGE